MIHAITVMIGGITVIYCDLRNPGGPNDLEHVLIAVFPLEYRGFRVSEVTCGGDVGTELGG
jgi:hypothetical protein